MPEVEIIDDDMTFKVISISEEELKKYYYNYKEIYIRKEQIQLRKERSYDEMFKTVDTYLFSCMVSDRQIDHLYSINRDDRDELISFHDADYPRHQIIHVHKHSSRRIRN